MHADALLKLLSEMVGDKRYEEISEKITEKNKSGEDIEMCEIFDKIEGRGIQKGIQQGIEIERSNSEKKIMEANKRAEAAEDEVRRLQKLLAASGK